MSKTTRIRYVPWLGTVSREVDTGVSEIETEGLEVESEELGAWVGRGLFFSCLLWRRPFAGQFAEQNLCFCLDCICFVKLPPLPQSHGRSPHSLGHVCWQTCHLRPALLAGSTRRRFVGRLVPLRTWANETDSWGSLVTRTLSNKWGASKNLQKGVR